MKWAILSKFMWIAVVIGRLENYNSESSNEMNRFDLNQLFGPNYFPYKVKLSSTIRTSKLTVDQMIEFS